MIVFKFLLYLILIGILNLSLAYSSQIIPPDQVCLSQDNQAQESVQEKWSRLKRELSFLQFRLKMQLKRVGVYDETNDEIENAESTENVRDQLRLINQKNQKFSSFSKEDQVLFFSLLKSWFEYELDSFTDKILNEEKKIVRIESNIKGLTGKFLKMAQDQLRLAKDKITKLISEKTNFQSQYSKYLDESSLDDINLSEFDLFFSWLENKLTSFREFEEEWRDSLMQLNAVSDLETIDSLEKRIESIKDYIVFENKLLPELEGTKFDCGFSFAERVALFWYSIDGYHYVNGYLRGKEQIYNLFNTQAESEKERTDRSNQLKILILPFVDTLKAALDKLNPYTEVVNRYIQLDGVDLVQFQNSHQVNFEAPMRQSFTSTTRSWKDYLGNIELSIRPISSCRWIAPYTLSIHEDEVLCLPNLKLKVTSFLVFDKVTKVELVEIAPN